MSLKITIEVDGHSEQQLAPALSRLATYQAERLDKQPGPPLSPQPSFFYENSARLQQQVQQLTVQNQRLQAQMPQRQPPTPVANDPKQLVGQGPHKALPASRKETALDVQASAEGITPTPREQPRLPVRYRLGPGERLSYQLKRRAQLSAQRLWQVLVWTAFGKAWLATALLLSGGLYGVFKAAPRLSRTVSQIIFHSPITPSRLLPIEGRAGPTLRPPMPESSNAKSFDDGPGDTLPAENTPKPAASHATPAVPTSEKRSAVEETLPIPAAPNDHHPPPPPAFQDNNIEYQER